jgi:hypothetical protein
MRPTENADNGVREGLRLLETWIDASANAQQQFFAEMRGKVSGMPLLDAGMRLAETLGRQRRDWAYLLLGSVRRAASAREAERAARAEERDSGPEWPRSESERGAPPRMPVLRITVPLGRPNVTVPLTLRNHRLVPDQVSLSTQTPDGPHAAIPPELIRFDPPQLLIEPQSERSVQLQLHIPHFVPPGQYWTQIVITGAETKRIQLAVDLVPPL